MIAKFVVSRSHANLSLCPFGGMLHECDASAELIAHKSFVFWFQGLKEGSSSLQENCRLPVV